MQYIDYYNSELGKILLTADDVGLTGLWFVGQKYFESALESEYKEVRTAVLDDAKTWLDIYFRGKEPDFIPELHMMGSKFRLVVWEILKKIPYGKTITYDEIANIIAEQKDIVKISAQAVGGAVGHNKISIIVPCHRVVGKKGSLTGYAGGLQRKVELLQLEKANLERLFIPKKGTAL